MWKAVEAAPGLQRLGRRSRRPARAASDRYEEHMLLPDDRVALMTNQRLMLVSAPGFAKVGTFLLHSSLTMCRALTAYSRFVKEYTDEHCVYPASRIRSSKLPRMVVKDRKGLELRWIINLLEMLTEPPVCRCMLQQRRASRLATAMTSQPARSAGLWSGRYACSCHSETTLWECSIGSSAPP